MTRHSCGSLLDFVIQAQKVILSMKLCIHALCSVQIVVNRLLLFLCTNMEDVRFLSHGNTVYLVILSVDVKCECDMFSGCCNSYLSIGIDSHQDAVSSAELS